MTRRAVLYARVSGDDRGKDGRNLESQLQMGRCYAQERGYAIVEEFAEDDRGASGADIDLPQLNRVRDLARAGDFDVLVVRELDRLSRNLAKQLVVEQELRAAGVAIEYVLGEYPDTPEGNLQKHIKAVIAEYERAKITERMVRGRRQKAKSGQVVTCGRIAYGYRPGEVDGKTTLEIYEPEAEVVRMIYDWYTGLGADGRLSSRAIARELKRLRIPTWGDIHPNKTRRTREPFHWSHAAVRKILVNETYAGTWQFGGIQVDVPAIVDSETWDAAQTRRARNKRQARRNRKHRYLLAGHVRCGACHTAMAGQTCRVDGHTYQYYGCRARQTPADYAHKCQTPYFRVGKVDATVWRWIRSLIIDPANLAAELQRLQSQQSEACQPLRARLDVLDGLIADNRHQQEKLLDLYLTGSFDKSILTERKERLQETINALERERINLAAQIEAQTLSDEQLETITAFAARVRQGLEAADTDFALQRHLVELLEIGVALVVEDDQRVAYVRCIVGDAALPIATTAISG